MNPVVKTVARRTAVTMGVVGSLGLGAASIGAAAQWTAASAPMSVPPVTAESLAAQLANEQARGSDLQSRLEATLAQAAQLQTALDTANARIGTDSKTAKALQAQIVAAQKKLGSLNRQAGSRAAAVRVVTVRRVVVTTATSKPKPTATTGASGTPEPGDN